MTTDDKTLISSIFSLRWNDFSANDSVSFATNHAKVFGGSGAQRRSGNDLIDEGRALVSEAMEKISYGWHSSGSLLCLAEGLIQAEGKICDITDADLRQRIVDVCNDDLTNAIVAYLATRGPFSSSRFWLLVTDAAMGVDGEERFLYVGFPQLATSSHHGAVLAAFCNEISAYLKAGGPSSILSFCKASGEEVHKTKIQYAFKKGMHVKGFPKDHHKYLIDDLQLIFDEMKGAKGSGNLSALKWLNKALLR